MSLAATTYDIADALMGPQAETSAPPKPNLLDRAIGGIERIFAEFQEREELIHRVSSLESEIDLLRQRDHILTRRIAKLDDEQRLAARIQHDFLPKVLPEIGDFRFHTMFRPAQYVSGDLYDVKRLDEQHVGIYLADAVGHGPPAALLTMYMKNALVTKLINGNSYRLLEPSETLATLNRALREANLAHASFATAVYAKVNCVSGHVTLARAGHPAPILFARDGTLREIECEGPLLGVFDEGEWTEAHFQLEPGDRLLFYTDGVETAFPRDGQPCTDTWKLEIPRMKEMGSASILEHFRAAIEGNSLAGQKDDLTMLIAEVAKAA